MAVADEFAAFFIPQAERNGFHARKEGDGFDLLKEWVGLVAFLQVVIGDARAEVVNVMEPDVAGEPLQDSGQLVKRTALQGRGGKTPVLTAFPVNILKL